MNGKNGSRTVKCLLCGAEFETTAPNVKYCSIGCKENGRKAKREIWERSNEGYYKEYEKKRRKQKMCKIEW